MPRAEAAEDAQHAGVVWGGIHLGTQFRHEFRGHRRTARRLPYRFQKLGIQGKRVREELRRGEQVESRFEPSASGFQQSRELRSGTWLREQTLQVVERHVRVGGAGQQASERGN